MKPGCFFSILLFFTTQFCWGFSVQEFKKLAHEMVSDLEKNYGTNFIQKSVAFDTLEFHRLIDRTQILPVKDTIENRFFDNPTQRWLTEKVDAINYFPKTERIEYVESTWQSLFSTEERNELKVMIHHEFVPYFTKAADRERVFDQHVRSIYDISYTFEDIKPGFYAPVRMNEPFYDSVTANYIYFISYIGATANMLVVSVVENPLNKLWCIDCYIKEPVAYRPLTPNNFVSRMNVDSRTELFGVLGRAADRSDSLNKRGQSFFQVIDKETIGIGVILDSYSGSLSEYVSQPRTENKLIILARMKNVDDFVWQVSKRLPIGVSLFRSKFQNSCDFHHQLGRKSVQGFCAVEEAKKDIKPGQCEYKNIKVDDVAKYYPHHDCAFHVSMELETRPDFYPQGQKRYLDIIDSWGKMRTVHLNVDRFSR